MTAIEEMLSNYELNDDDLYKQAFKEIMQEVVLCGLSRGGFFDKAAFTGGTALRIVHGIKRFSEDLDFSLFAPDANFSLERYLPYIKNELNANGFDIEFGKVNNASTVKSAFIKADTYKLILNFLSLDPDTFNINKTEKIKVKLEIDTNPPEGAVYSETSKVLPSPYVIRMLDISSMFALKTHAILCRNYVKGRDYYDYQCFFDRDVSINENLLRNALYQTENKLYTKDDIVSSLKNTFKNVNIEDVKKDVRRFLETPDDINGWTYNFFLDTVTKLNFNTHSDDVNIDGVSTDSSQVHRRRR